MPDRAVRRLLTACCLLAVGFASGWLVESRRGPVAVNELLRDSVGRPSSPEPSVRESTDLVAVDAQGMAQRRSVSPPEPSTMTQTTLNNARVEDDELASAVELYGKELLESSWLAGQDLSFLEQYRGFSFDQLRLAHQELQARRISEGDRIAAERMKNGLYETQIVPAGASAQGVNATPERPVVTFGVSMERGNGYTIVKTAVIDPLEYPELGLIEKEVWWLGSLVRKIETEMKHK